MIPRLSRSHWMREPVTAIEPSSAYTGSSSPSRYATVVMSPFCEWVISVPVFKSRKFPVP